MTRTPDERRRANAAASKHARDKDPEAYRAYKRAYYIKHIEHERQRCRDWAASNPRNWNKRQRPDRTEESRLRLLRHPDRIDQSNRRRRASLAGVRHEPYNALDIYARDQSTCQICHEAVDLTLTYPHPRSRSLDHITPLSRGGHDTAANIRLTHLSCNLRKGAKRPPITMPPIYHP